MTSCNVAGNSKKIVLITVLISYLVSQHCSCRRYSHETRIGVVITISEGCVIWVKNIKMIVLAKLFFSNEKGFNAIAKLQS